MDNPRRSFLQNLGGALVAGALLPTASSAEAAVHGTLSGDDASGVLVDLSACVGCRLCEYACKEANGIDPGPLSAYDDTSVFAVKRRPMPDSYTVVNAWPNDADDKPVYAKVNCLHCNHPACASACIVGALQKQPDGAVTYDAWKCIGCRYCMVACPFQIPAYSYHDVLTPKVHKCEFCHERQERGQAPACVEACPRQAMTFGKRSDLLKLAHQRIAQRPDCYVDHVYGEHEVGGTSWLYVAPMPLAKAGFLTLGQAAPPALTEAIQHGVFKYWIAPVGWYAALCAMMWRTRLSGEPALAGVSTCQAHDSHRVHHAPAPINAKLLTPGVWFLLALVGVGLFALAYRFIFGLAASTNLDQQHPWGLWIAMDVGSGIALAGGGFVTAFLVHVLHREHYHAVARSALLTALLGYTFYVPGLLADIGRWYNIWHPTIPTMWQGNSVLFEVGLCVMIYLNVQYAELAPIVCERLLQVRREGRIAAALRLVHHGLEKIMPALLVLGVALSTFHQSSLGNLMVIAPYKLHALWWTPLSPLLFLLSAMMVGFPMVIFTMLFASWSLQREPEMHVLSKLARYVPWLLGVYLAVKVGDVLWRDVYAALWQDGWHGPLWVLEVVLGVVLPMVLLTLRRVRESPRALAIACLLVILGVVLNRLNVFVLAYHPPYAEKAYFPSLIEFALSAGLVAALLLVYRMGVTWLPILEPRPRTAG